MTCKAVISVVGFRGVPGSVAGQGNDGKSAYEIAVENGFVGTEAQWLASLQGDDGIPGVTPDISIGTVTSGAQANVTRTGTDEAPVLNFVLPKGDAGVTPNISIAPTITGAAGTAASVSRSGTDANPILTFTIPRGADGTNGVDGVDGADGVNGTNGVDGVDGADGAPGAAATITVGTTTTVEPDVPAEVSNVGTTSAAILNFKIPRGERGYTGSGSNSAYESVASMVDDSALTVGAYVRTLGYHEAGDGGGADYEIVSGSTVIGYDEPNIQAYNFIPSIYLKSPFSGNWIRQNVAALGSGSLAAALLAPDETVSADFVAETSATGVHYVQLNQTMGAANSLPLFPAAPTEFVSYVAKYDAGDPTRRPYYHCGFALGSNYSLAVNQATSIIDLSSGAVTAFTYGDNLMPAKTVVVDADDYWLVKLQVTPASVGQCYWQMGASNSPTTNSYAGSDPAVQPKGVYIWGWAIRPLVTPGIMLTNGLQAKPLLSNTVRLSQFAAAAGGDNNAMLRALGHFGTNPGTLVIDVPTTFTQPSSLPTLIIPSNVTLRFEGAGSLAGVTNLTVNSQIIADNRAILPKALSATFGPRQRSVLSNWFGL